MLNRFYSAFQYSNESQSPEEGEQKKGWGFHQSLANKLSHRCQSEESHRGVLRRQMARQESENTIVTDPFPIITSSFVPQILVEDTSLDLEDNKDLREPNKRHIGLRQCRSSCLPVLQELELKQTAAKQFVLKRSKNPAVSFDLPDTVRESESFTSFIPNDNAKVESHDVIVPLEEPKDEHKNEKQNQQEAQMTALKQRRKSSRIDSLMTALHIKRPLGPSKSYNHSHRANSTSSSEETRRMTISQVDFSHLWPRLKSAMGITKPVKTEKRPGLTTAPLTRSCLSPKYRRRRSSSLSSGTYGKKTSFVMISENLQETAKSMQELTTYMAKGSSSSTNLASKQKSDNVEYSMGIRGARYSLSDRRWLDQPLSMGTPRQTAQDTLTVLVVGSAKTGKTSLISKLQSNADLEPRDEQAPKLLFVEVNNQTNDLWTSLDAQITVMVCSSTSPCSINNAIQMLMLLKKQQKFEKSDTRQKHKYFFAVSKSDLPDPDTKLIQKAKYVCFSCDVPVGLVSVRQPKSVHSLLDFIQQQNSI